MNCLKYCDNIQINFSLSIFVKGQVFSWHEQNCQHPLKYSHMNILGRGRVSSRIILCIFWYVSDSFNKPSYWKFSILLIFNTNFSLTKVREPKTRQVCFICREISNVCHILSTFVSTERVIWGEGINVPVLRHCGNLNFTRTLPPIAGVHEGRDAEIHEGGSLIKCGISSTAAAPKKPEAQRKRYDYTLPYWDWWVKVLILSLKWPYLKLLFYMQFLFYLDQGRAWITIIVLSHNYILNQTWAYVVGSNRK